MKKYRGNRFQKALKQSPSSLNGLRSLLTMARKLRRIAYAFKINRSILKIRQRAFWNEIGREQISLDIIRSYMKRVGITPVDQLREVTPEEVARLRLRRSFRDEAGMDTDNHVFLKHRRSGITPNYPLTRFEEPYVPSTDKKPNPKKKAKNRAKNKQHKTHRR